MPVKRHAKSAGGVPGGLRAARAWAGLTIQDVADRIGVARTTVNDWERGASECTPDWQERVAAACGVAPWVIARGLIDDDAPAERGGQEADTVESLASASMGPATRKNFAASIGHTQSELELGETPVAVAYGLDGNRATLVVVTDRRLMFARRGDDVPGLELVDLANVRGAASERAGTTSVLSVTYGRKTTKVRNMSPVTSKWLAQSIEFGRRTAT
jgi:DNA-binding XRE family transcriptional regulator